MYSKSLLHSAVSIVDPRRFMDIRAAVTTTNRRERERDWEKGRGAGRGKRCSTWAYINTNYIRVTTLFVYLYTFAHYFSSKYTHIFSKSYNVKQGHWIVYARTTIVSVCIGN